MHSESAPLLDSRLPHDIVLNIMPEDECLALVISLMKQAATRLLRLFIIIAAPSFRYFSRITRHICRTRLPVRRLAAYRYGLSDRRRYKATVDAMRPTILLTRMRCRRRWR